MRGDAGAQLSTMPRAVTTVTSVDDGDVELRVYAGHEGDEVRARAAF